MAIRADVMVAVSTGAHYTGAGVNYVVETPAGVLYQVFVNNASDVVFVKSSNGGISWSEPVEIFSGTATALSIWYDRWSSISAGLIHCAYSESVTDDTFYRTIDTESGDALSTQTAIFVGTSTAAAGSLSITRARGGNVYCKTVIDAGAEGGFFRLPNANVPNGAWDAARTVNEALATGDQMILMPGWAADNQDIMAFFWDISADEISRQLYDDSANTWSETLIAGTMVENAAANGFPHFAAAVDIANSRNLLVAWSAIDAANADLRCWHVTESAITEVTNVVLNGTDDQGFCGIAIDTTRNYWFVAYGGKSDGSETWPTAMNLYYKVSTDSGSTWGPETALTTITRQFNWLAVTPRCAGQPGVLAQSLTTAIPMILASINIAAARANFQLGVA
jgi:hypothetical protein